MSLASIDKHQVRYRSPRGSIRSFNPLEAAPEHLLHHGVVVYALHRPYLEATVRRWLGASVLKNDHAPYRGGAPYVGYIVTLYSVRQPRQVQFSLKLLQCLGGLAAVSEPLRLELCQRMLSVLSHHVHQLLFLSPL